MVENQRKTEDEKLVERVKKGDDTAFEELMNAYKGKIYQMALSRVKDSKYAEKLTQNIFANIKQHLKSWQSQRVKFATWLYRMALNYISRITRQKTSEDISSQLKIYRISLN